MLVFRPNKRTSINTRCRFLGKLSFDDVFIQKIRSIQTLILLIVLFASDLKNSIMMKARYLTDKLMKRQI